MGYFYLILELLLCIVVGYICAKDRFTIGPLIGFTVLSHSISNLYFIHGIGLASATVSFWVILILGVTALLGSYTLFKRLSKSPISPSDPAS